MSFSSPIGVVILAAGASTRLGEPKQLLEFDHKNLLQGTIDAAVNSNANNIVVVLGANAAEISTDIDKSKINVIINSDWQEGMASSIRAGLNELLFIAPETEAIIIAVCDQPYISSQLLNDLISRHVETEKPIVASDYGEAIGPPTLFQKSLFHELMHLTGDTGARKIIQHHKDDVSTILFTKGNIDIDTREDFDALRNS